MGYFDDKNQWGIIIGGSSGLGFASAYKLASEGMNLIIVHRDKRSDRDTIEAKFEELRAFGVKVESFNMDAVNGDKMNELIEQIPTLIHHGKIKVLLHSIAKGNLKRILKDDGLSLQDFNLTIQSMGTCLYAWVKALLEADLFQKDSRVLAFTSEGSYKSQMYYAAVSAAKATLESIVRSIALELAPFEIKANCIQAGTTKTAALMRIPNSDELIEYSIKRNPYQRLTTPEDVGNVVFLMTMDESSWINGSIIPVDGGEHLR